MTLVLQTLLVFLYAILVFCLGSLLLKKAFRLVADQNQLSYTSQWITALLVGQGVLAVLWQSLGLMGLFSPKIILAVLILSLISSGRYAHELTRHALLEFKGTWHSFRQETRLWRALALLCLLMFITLAMTSFAGPVVVGSDASGFYMVLPKMMAAAHHLVPTTDYVAKHSTFGFIGEMHFAALMSLGAATAAKGFSFLTGLAAAVMLVNIGALAGLSRRACLIVLIILLNTTTFTNYMCDGKVDVFGAAFGVSAVYWALQKARLPGRSALIITGLLLGWAIYAKLSALVALAPCVALILVWREYLANPDQGLSRALIAKQTKDLFILGALVVLLLIPLSLKNLILFGEPWAPVYYFSKSWGTWFAVRGYTDSDVIRLIFTYPLALVLGDYNCQAGNISPLILIFAPLAFMLPKTGNLKKSTLFQVSLAALMGLVIWIIVFPKGIGPRFVLPTLLMFSLFAAHSAAFVLKSETKPRVLSAAIWVILFFIPIFFLYQGFKYYLGPVHYWSKMQNPAYEGRQHLEGRHPVLVALDVINRKARPGDRVLMGMIYRYWLRADLLQTLFSNKEWRVFHRTPWSVPRWAYLYDRGVKYVVLDTLTHNHLQKELNIKKNGHVKWKPPWLKIKRIYHDYRWSVFSIESTDPKRRPKVRGQQIRPPLWEVAPTENNGRQKS